MPEGGRAQLTLGAPLKRLAALGVRGQPSQPSACPPPIEAIEDLNQARLWTGREPSW